jgi:hypothetical protein
LALAERYESRSTLAAQLSHRRRDNDPVGFSFAAQAMRKLHGRTEQIVMIRYGLAGVDADPYSEALGRLGVVRKKTPLNIRRSTHRTRDVVEHGHHPARRKPQVRFAKSNIIFCSRRWPNAPPASCRTAPASSLTRISTNSGCFSDVDLIRARD